MPLETCPQIDCGSNTIMESTNIKFIYPNLDLYSFPTLTIDPSYTAEKLAESKFITTYDGTVSEVYVDYETVECTITSFDAASVTD